MVDPAEVVRGVLIAVPSVLIAWWGYRRSTKVDATAAQSGAATESRAGIEQVIDALNDLVDRLQADNQNFRDAIQLQAKRVDDLEKDNRQWWESIQLLKLRLDVVEKERDNLQRAVDRMIAEHGAA